MHDDTLGEPRPRSSPTPISRRNVLRTGAWSLPVITMASPLPAFADSSAYIWTLAPLQDVSGMNCVNIEGTYYAVKLSNGPEKMPANATVTVTLPDGLTFHSGPATEATIAIVAGTSPDQNVLVPSFRSTGRPGSYPITAQLRYGTHTVDATSRLVANISSGPHQIVTKAKTSESQAGFAPTYVTHTAAPVAISIGGNIGAGEGASSTAMILGSEVAPNSGLQPHSVVIEGYHYASRRVIARPSEATVWTMLDTFVSDGITNETPTYRHRVAGIVANDTDVTEWREDAHAETPQPFITRQVTGLAGRVLDVAVENSLSFALTTGGFYIWPNTFSLPENAQAIPPITPRLNRDITDPGALLSTWTEDRRRMHNADQALKVGALVYEPTSQTHPGGVLTAYSYRLTGNSSETNPSIPTGFTIDPPPGSGGITQIEASSAGIVALGKNGLLYFRGPGHESEPQPSVPTGRAHWVEGNYAWKQLTSAVVPSDVLSFSSWGSAARYHGGLWVTGSGQVGQWYGSAGTPPTSQSAIVTTTSHPEKFTNISQVSAGSGNYMARNDQGVVWTWGGNLNQSTRTSPTVVEATLATPAAGIGTWSLRHNFTTSESGTSHEYFLGGGYTHESQPLC